MQNDFELVDGLKQGEEKAYQKLFKLYFEPLTHFAYKYLKDIDAAQDLVQDVFSQVFEKRAELNIRQSLKSFLYRSVANSSLNHLKHEEVKNRNHREILHYSENEFSDQQIELNELELKIQRSINTLPPQCARIFKMSRFEDLSNAEIADALNISKRTVETQISKALKELSKMLYILILENILKNF